MLTGQIDVTGIYYSPAEHDFTCVLNRNIVVMSPFNPKACLSEASLVTRIRIFRSIVASVPVRKGAAISH